MLVCDYTGNGINLDGTKDTSFFTTIRGTLADSTTGESGTFSGWIGTNYPVKIVLDENGNTIQLNGNNVMFFPSSVTASNCSNTSTPYDCINGACRPATQFNTPGLYTSLSECEVACGTGCSGKCISNKDWLTIQSLASHLKHKNCS